MPTPRTPRAIAAEARALSDKSNKAFVPMPLQKALELSLEFMEAVAAMTPEDEAPAAPAAPIEPPAV